MELDITMNAYLACIHVGVEKQQKVMAKVGVEPKTFELLARRSNQLSYSAAEEAASLNVYQHQLRYRLSGTSLCYRDCYPHTFANGRHLQARTHI